MCKVYTGYCGISEKEHGLCACTVDNPLAKARGLSLRTGAQPMLYLPLIVYYQFCSCNLTIIMPLLRYFKLNISGQNHTKIAIIGVFNETFRNNKNILAILNNGIACL